MERLTSPRMIHDIQKKYDFHFSKRYGQNFLTDGNIIEKILEGADIQEEDYILEIGPGIGTMTQYLCERSAHVLAVEIDQKLIPILNDTLRDYSNKTILNEDVLRINLKEELKKISDKPFKVIANLPYYITSEIIMNLLERDLPIESITVMVQKEVAERMIAPPGKKDYGALSVAVQFYSKPQIVTIVPKTVFMPQPKVESAVINLKILDEPPVEAQKEVFFKVVKASFSMRRKTLLNCLSNGLNMDRQKVIEVLEKCDIDGKRRGETLSLKEFAKIANEITV
ncbi:16S rRNA (adenine(1518)-N(6)/adenine(1519)-N(6))-dimethyltransferase RsmA [Alkalibaculum bacchi]|mgnify:CR=1 FL=1|uniref:16S rRNA (adenine(1518)-N(6)/adenine(1519)-N(6))- dimethyltransferase RsmA n=1 Tax=Alkalibaculum bacchi TaxID=645887 RepID=UPI0026ECBEE1|nr:16S rRNA (adenine(1518)-N(6)/adenine(1519)-N(6))-dimethyltransferase RsmA [Alkalibaculum bacchi]